MTEILITAPDGRELIVDITDAVCTICGKRVTIEDFQAQRMIATGGGGHDGGRLDNSIFACIDHFKNPGSKAYKRNMDKLGMHLAVKLGQERAKHGGVIFETVTDAFGTRPRPI